MNDDIMNTATAEAALPERGSFAEGPRGETREQRRERYEQWVLATDGGKPDYEGRAVRFGRDRGGASLALSIASACWLCVAGDEDANGRLRVAGCGNRRCGLWPVRPYQGDQPEDDAADATEVDARAATAVPRTGRRVAVNAFCSQCVGRCAGGSWTEVELCPAVTCAIWPVRAKNGAPDAGGADTAGLSEAA